MISPSFWSWAGGAGFAVLNLINLRSSYIVLILYYIVSEVRTVHSTVDLKKP
jgi:hypothetical protein